MFKQITLELTEWLRLTVIQGYVSPGRTLPAHNYILYKNRIADERAVIYKCLVGTNIYWVINKCLCFMMDTELIVIRPSGTCTQWNPNNRVIELEFDATEKLVIHLQRLIDMSNRCLYLFSR